MQQLSSHTTYPRSGLGPIATSLNQILGWPKRLNELADDGLPDDGLPDDRPIAPNRLIQNRPVELSSG